MLGSKPLRIRIYGGIRYSVLFRSENMMLFMIKLDILLVKKSGITHILSHNFAKAKNFSFNTLPLEKSLNLDNIIILINSAFNKDHSDKCSYDIF